MLVLADRQVTKTTSSTRRCKFEFGQFLDISIDVRLLCPKNVGVVIQRETWWLTAITQDFQNFDPDMPFQSVQI